MKNTEKSFKWIINILNENDIPFQISGGLAARAYGSDRELADIDIEIPDDKVRDLAPYVKEYITFGPQFYKDDNWKLFLMTLNYEGQEIDICGGESRKIFNQTEKKWISLNFDLSKAVQKEIFDLAVPVIPKDYLITYKTQLARPVDIEDIRKIGL